METQPSLGQKATAELLGTFILTFFGGVAAISSGLSKPLVFSNLADLLALALTLGLALACAIHIFGKISGGHYNPAVTVAMVVTRRIRLPEAGAYIVAQILGASLAALVHFFLFDNTRLFITAPAPTTVWSAAVFAEVLGTFLLVSVIFGVAVDDRAPAGWAGWMIGMALAVGVLALGPISGASFNPAVSTGPRLIASLVGGNPQWASWIIFLIGPVIGGTLAALIYSYVAGLSPATTPTQKATSSVVGPSRS